MLIFKIQQQCANAGCTRIPVGSLVHALTWFLFMFFATATYADPGDQKPSSIETEPSVESTVQTINYTLTDPERVFDMTIPETQAIVDDHVVGTYILPPIEDGSHDEYESSHEIIIPPHNGIYDEEIEIGTDCTEQSKRLNFNRTIHERYRTYRSHQSNLAWLPGSGGNFGMVEWTSDPYLDRDETSGITGAMNLTWLSGPTTTALPPRVYDISLGYQMRRQWTSQFSYDLATSIGIFSDFQGSARDGVRFPSHAVGMLHINHSTDLVFGADFLDRDDISVLPVFGLSLRNDRFPRLRTDLIFPRPRIDYTFSDTQRIYLAGQLGGGTWDIDDGVDLVTTYRDYRITLGFESADTDGSTSAIEFGYIFGRQLEVRGQRGHTEFDDAFMIRWISRN